MFQNDFSMGRMTQNEQIQLVSLNLYPTRDFHDQWRRSYTMQLTGSTEQALHDMLNQYGPDKTFSNFGVSQMNALQTGNQSGVGTQLNSGGLIRYSATPTSQVHIAHGWGTKRMRFELIVNTIVNGTPKFREIIVGHTDHYGATHLTGQAKLDPSMVFTIDSVVREPIEQVFGVAGMMAANQVGTADVVITNQAPIANPFTPNTNASLFTMRPQDVFTVADSIEMINGASDGDYMTQNGLMTVNSNTYIADTTLSHMAKPSNRRNDLLNSYTSRLLTNMYQSSAIQASPASDDFLSPQSQAMMKVKEQHMSNYGFTFCITRLAGGTCSTTGQFTYTELMRLDPSIDQRATVFEFTEDSGIFIPPTGATELAYAGNDRAIMANMASNTVLSLMNTHGIMQISCICDNYTGQPRCIVSGAMGPTEQNRNTIIANFESAMVLEFLSIVSASAIGSFKISIYAEAFNIVYVSITLNGEHQETPFVFPAWASAAGTPVVSNSFDQLSGMAETVNNVVGNAVKGRALMHNAMASTPMGVFQQPQMPQPHNFGNQPIITGTQGNPGSMADFPSATPTNPSVGW